MKLKALVSLILLGGSLSVFAQGYKDGIEYYKVGQYDNAKELLMRNFNDASTNKSEAYYYLGCLDMKAGKVADAKANFEKGLAADANNPYNLIGLGSIALKNNDVKTAEELFNNAQKLTKKNASVEAAIARAYTEADPVAYAKAIEKATKNAYKYSKNTNPDIYILEGDVKAAEKNWGEAAGMYEQAINADANNIEAYVKYANTYYNVAPDMAINKLNEILANKPNSALLQRELAEKYYKNEQWAKAAVQYGKYIENPNHFTQDRSRYAFLLFYGQKYEESLALSKELVASLPTTDPQNFYMKRMSLYNLVALKNWNAAEAAANELFSATLPEGVKYEAKDYTDYATTLKELGRTQEALAQYEKAVELNPDKVELLKEISDAYLDAEQYAKSAEAYQRFFDSGKGVTNDLLVLSQRYSNVAATDTTDNKFVALEKAIKYADEINAKVPNHPRILFQIARCKMMMDKETTDGNALEAMKNLTDLLDQDPANKTNRANDYVLAYRYNAVYYASIAGKIKKEDKNYKDNEEYNNSLAKMKEAYENWLSVDPTNEGLRKYVESLNAPAKK